MKRDHRRRRAARLAVAARVAGMPARCTAGRRGAQGSVVGLSERTAYLWFPLEAPAKELAARRLAFSLVNSGCRDRGAAQAWRLTAASLNWLCRTAAVAKVLADAAPAALRALHVRLGAFVLSQAVERWSCSATTARRRLDHLLARGLVHEQPGTPDGPPGERRSRYWLTKAARRLLRAERP